MTHLLRRGLTFYARLTIPKDRWADVGKAMRAKSGIQREIVRTLQTTDFREAQRRRDVALSNIREEVDGALVRAKLSPLTDWTGDWEGRATRRRQELEDGAKVITHWEESLDGSGEGHPWTVRDLVFEEVMSDADVVEVRRGLQARRDFEVIALSDEFSIGEAARLWKKEIHGTVQETTWRGHTAALAILGGYLAEKHGWSTLKAVSLKKLTRRIAGEFIATRRSTKAAATVQREFSTYSGLWRWAVRRGYTDLNPWTDQTAGLKVRRKGDVEDDAKRAYSPPELVLLLRAGPSLLSPGRGGYAPVLWDAIRLALLTGCRASELMGLRRKDVIEDGAAIVATAAGKTKNAPRIIPLPAFAQRVVMDRMATLTDGSDDATLWPEVPTMGLSDKRAKAVSTRFVIVRRRILGDGAGVDFHSLRRTTLTAFETAMHAGGRLNSDLMALLAGHKRGAMSLDLYSEWGRLGRRRVTAGFAERMVTLRDAMEDMVSLGLAPEVLAALSDTAESRPPAVRLAPAFRRH